MEDITVGDFVVSNYNTGEIIVRRKDSLRASVCIDIPYQKSGLRITAANNKVSIEAHQGIPVIVVD